MTQRSMTDDITGRCDDATVRRMYTRVLTRWAADTLEIRRRGLDVPQAAETAPATAGLARRRSHSTQTGMKA